jgi:hypothetical protein
MKPNREHPKEDMINMVPEETVHGLKIRLSAAARLVKNLHFIKKKSLYVRPNQTGRSCVNLF